MQAKLYGKPERRRLGRWRTTCYRSFWIAEMLAVLLVWYYAIKLMLAEGLL